MRTMTETPQDLGGEPDTLPHTNTPKSFAQFLVEQSSGQVHAELSDKLRDLVEAMEMHFNKFPGKTEGEIGVKFKLVLDRGVYKVKTEYTVKHPKAPVAETIMWLGQGGDLVPNNPRQLTMFGDKPRVVV
jgi:hypothetical protein